MMRGVLESTLDYMILIIRMRLYHRHPSLVALIRVGGKA